MQGRSGASSRHYALMRGPARGTAVCDAAGGSGRRAGREASSAGARAAGLGLDRAAVADGAAGHGSGRTSPSESPSTSCAMRLSKNGRLRAGGASAACPDGRGFAAHAGRRRPPDPGAPGASATRRRAAAAPRVTRGACRRQPRRAAGSRARQTGAGRHRVGAQRRSGGVGRAQLVDIVDLHLLLRPRARVRDVELRRAKQRASARKRMRRALQIRRSFGQFRRGRTFMLPQRSTALPG